MPFGSGQGRIDPLRGNPNTRTRYSTTFPRLTVSDAAQLEPDFLKRASDRLERSLTKGIDAIFEDTPSRSQPFALTKASRNAARLLRSL